MRTSWLVNRRPHPAARLRLVCVPYAGGGASAYAQWAQELAPDLEVHAVRLPGRESRLSEPPLTDVRDVVAALGEELLAAIRPPFVLFGHSMGALIAYELTRWLRAVGGPGPERLLVSGRQAPHLARRVRSPYDLPDAEFVEALRSLGGTPEEVLGDAHVMRLLMPVLRADFRLNDAYRHRPGKPLDCPVSAFGGRDDPVVGEDGLRAWQAHTEGPFTLHMFDGGHFFPHSAQRELLSVVGREVGAGCPVLAGTEGAGRS
ncbi:alpha/beta fold hydrolase [Streptomyces flaveolus]|uniref:thioesterase II family protein n=1 Tax=Streptomyces flaveolus TaxID=67297 RepID=UPI0034374EFD